jgi:hypothetical protein
MSSPAKFGPAVFRVPAAHRVIGGRPFQLEPAGFHHQTKVFRPRRALRPKRATPWEWLISEETWGDGRQRKTGQNHCDEVLGPAGCDFARLR